MIYSMVPFLVTSSDP